MSTLKRIMFVDDEPDIRAVGVLALETFGDFEVHECSSGTEALEKAPEVKPDLIVLDVMMPGMGGPQTLKQLQANPATASIPVIFFTAKMRRDDMQELCLPGAVGLITKPFEPTTLADEIEAIWDSYNEAKPAA